MISIISYFLPIFILLQVSSFAQQNDYQPPLIDPIAPPPLYIDEMPMSNTISNQNNNVIHETLPLGLSPPPALEGRSRRFVVPSVPSSAYSDSNGIGNGAELNGNQPYNTGGTCSVCAAGGGPTYNPPPPPPPAQYGPWSEWSQCSTACNACGTTSTQTRHRDCRPPSGACRGVADESRPCAANWAGWGAWSTCSVTCGRGSQTRSRACLLNGQSTSSAFCSGGADEAKNCEAGSCCYWGQWGAWSACSAGGSRTRARACSCSTCSGAATETSSCTPPLAPGTCSTCGPAPPPACSTCGGYAPSPSYSPPSSGYPSSANGPYYNPYNNQK